MADSIVRLKVDSQEYDAKLKRAAEGLQRYTDQCRKVGGTLEVVEQETLDYVRALGQMETTAKTARGKLAEMTKAFTDMSVQYKNLTDEEKKGEFGKTLNASLNELKVRIQESKTQLDDVTKSINGGGGFGGALDSIADKFGMNIKQLASFGTAIGVAKVALDTAKDAFFANETQLDEWGRTVQSTESLYNGFLNALNTGDISGYLSRMDEIVNAARDAYNAMDELGTFNAFTRGSRAGLRSNYSEALNEYKLNPTAENKKALAEANKALVEGLQQQADKIKNGYEKSLNSLGVDRLLKGQQLEDFKNLFRQGKYDELDRLKAGYKQGTLLNAGSQYWYGDRVYDGKIQDRFTGKWRVMDEDEKKQFEFARVLAQVNDKQIDAVQALDEQYKNTLDAINNQNRSYNRLAGNNGKVNPGKGGSGGGTTTTKVEQTEMQTLQKQIQELEQEYIKLGGITTEDANNRRSEIQSEIAANETRINQIKLLGEQAHGKLMGGDVQTTGLSRAGVTGTDLRTPTLVQGISSDALESAKAWQKAGNDSAEAWKNAASAVSMVGNALSGIEDPAARVMGTIAQAIANIALAYAEALAKDKTNKSNIWYFIGTAAVMMASMVSTISQIHQATGYAQGGLVKGGGRYSGDNIPIMANEGELVLTKAMQGNLASQLNNNGGFAGNFDALVSGENIHIVHNRYLKRSGQGEIVTWKE